MSLLKIVNQNGESSKSTKRKTTDHQQVPILFTATNLFLLIRNTQETRGPKISKRVCPYIWVYIVYMFFDDFF
jgi:hypothetical protein